MAEAAVSFLLKNVKELSLSYIKLSSGSEKELRQLENELEMMKSLLEQSAKEQDKGDVRKKFEKQIREVVYEVEDTIDRCVTKAATGGRMNFLHSKISLAKEVKSLTEDRVKPLFCNAMVGLRNPNVGDAAAHGHDSTHHALAAGPKASLLREDNVVGFEEEAVKIINYIKKESDELDVISIIGMPGLGKTTLAWIINRDPWINFEFPVVIWANVSQEFKRKELFLNILKGFTQQDMSGMDDQELAKKLRGYLKDGKFLLFLDDVWTNEAWDDINAILPKNNRSGKVVITSRNEEVALHANPRRDPHNLKFLTEEESWELLQLEIFGKVGECPNDLALIGKDIAKKCGGVPLALVVIGGVLQKRYLAQQGGDSATKREWERVAESVGLYLNSEERTKNIISMSYNELTYDLRDCFLYLGVFPEDYEIPMWKLTRLWIAEGFIKDPKNRDKSLEDIAEDNFRELVHRNLVMVAKLKPDGKVKTCRVQGMIREFCRKEAAFEEQNLYQEMRMSKEFGVLVPSVTQIEKYRRLCIHSHVSDLLSKKLNGQQIRSFLCFSHEPIQLQPEHVHTIPRAFPLLRVFDAIPMKFPLFPHKLTQLVHVRYIAVCGDNFKVVPEALSKLWNVQTVTIDTSSSNNLNVDADILGMKQLRHFKTNASILLKTKGRGGAAENLQTLSRLSPEWCTEEVFDRTPNLKTLGIRGRLSLLSGTKSLTKLRSLEKLRLVNDAFPLLPSENPLQDHVLREAFPPKLRILTLSATHLDWKQMSTLGVLEYLEVLKLKEYAFKGNSWEASDDGFQYLQSLHIERTDLKFWKVSGNAFPILRCLVLRKCEKLKEVPRGLAKSLQKLEMEFVTKSAVACAKEIEQVKKQMQGQATKRGGFKLNIAPGDQY